MFINSSRISGLFAAVTLIWAAGAEAQSGLTLAEAMARAKTATPEARALTAGVGEADERIRQARAGYLPRVDASESVQRGDQPVFVFGSLLSQRRFSADRFAIEALNHPDALTNVRTAVTVEQSVFDGGATGLAVRGADLGRQLADARRGDGQQDLAVRAATAFVRTLQAEEVLAATQATIDAAESDLERARLRRDAGLVTDADVLAMEAYLAGARQARVTADADRRAARLMLNAAIGAPLDDGTPLVRPVAPPASTPTPDAALALVAQALAMRQDRRVTTLQSELAETGLRGARAALMPRVAAQAGWELNGGSWLTQRASWVVGGQVQVNLFRGFADTARIAEARAVVTRTAAERAAVDRRIEVEVRTALLRVDAARARLATGVAAAAQARESHRIVRERYEAGLATMTDVLRGLEALAAADLRASTAELDVVLESVMRDRAAGDL